MNQSGLRGSDRVSVSSIGRGIDTFEPGRTGEERGNEGNKGNKTVYSNNNALMLTTFFSFS